MIKSLAYLAFKLGPVQANQLNRQSIMNFKHLALTILLLSPALTLPSPSQAQTDTNAPKRALNLARDTAIRMNGGLSNYRPGRCMYRGSLTIDALPSVMPLDSFFTSQADNPAGRNPGRRQQKSPCCAFPPMDAQ